jgi:hypothetical protein
MFPHSGVVASKGPNRVSTGFKKKSTEKKNASSSRQLVANARDRNSCSARTLGSERLLDWPVK